MDLKGKKNGQDEFFANISLPWDYTWWKVLDYSRFLNAFRTKISLKVRKSPGGLNGSTNFYGNIGRNE